MPYYYNKQGKIDIKFNLNNGNYYMIVSDNVIGFPQHYNIQNSDSLGLKIVNSLTEQIDGEIKIEMSE
jgi:two-component sensor histidine kinase